MARTISATVGLKATNRNADVLTIQDMLNRVPVDQGRPKPILKLDGLCGNKTKTAIQKFQLHHFGWSGADGRVDPDGQTLVKLNDLQPSQPAPPHTVPPKPPIVRHTHFMLIQPGTIGTPMDDPGDFFFRVMAGSNDDASSPRSFHINEIALYWLGKPGLAPRRVKTFLRTGRVPASLLQVKSPGLTLQELNCPANFSTREIGGGKLSSSMTLFFKPTGPNSRTGAKVKMHRHLSEPPPKNVGPGVSYHHPGEFQFIRHLEE